MRLFGVFAIATLVALALQTTIPRLLPFDILVPDLTLVLAVDLGLRYHGMAAALTAFAIGYATDAFFYRRCVSLYLLKNSFERALESR